MNEAGLTTRLGVIGFPIDHSLSPTMQRAGLRRLGLPWHYAPFAVDPGAAGALERALAGARALGLVGLNVTMPHKQAALRLCRPDALAQRAGAVNTLHFHPDDDPGDPPRGFNTDLHGFVQLAIEAGCPLRDRHQAQGLRVVVLGAGGAARAVLLALSEAGVPPRQIAVAQRRLSGAGSAGDDGIQRLPLEAAALGPLLDGCDLLVDTTPRGLMGRPLADSHPELASSLERLPQRCAVLDLVVRRHTPLVTAAAARGLAASAGAPMLLHQGVAALSLWLGRPIPDEAVEAMRQALATALLAPA